MGRRREDSKRKVERCEPIPVNKLTSVMICDIQRSFDSCEFALKITDSVKECILNSYSSACRLTTRSLFSLCIRVLEGRSLESVNPISPGADISHESVSLFCPPSSSPLSAQSSTTQFFRFTTNFGRNFCKSKEGNFSDDKIKIFSSSLRNHLGGRDDTIVKQEYCNIVKFIVRVFFFTFQLSIFPELSVGIY
jgi:hypothetical protein